MAMAAPTQHIVAIIHESKILNHIVVRTRKHYKKSKRDKFNVREYCEECLSFMVLPVKKV
jgi:hypothetical protein